MRELEFFIKYVEDNPRRRPLNCLRLLIMDDEIDLIQSLIKAEEEKMLAIKRVKNLILLEQHEIAQNEKNGKKRRRFAQNIKRK